MFDSVESLFIVNETDIGPIYYSQTLSLNYCSEIVNSFPGNFSCHKATLGLTDHRFNLCLFHLRTTFSSIFDIWLIKLSVR